MMFDVMFDVLVKGYCIEIWGFGSFGFNCCLVCVGCNLKLGEKVQVFEKFVLYFKFGKELCECVDGCVGELLKVDDLDDEC